MLIAHPSRGAILLEKKNLQDDREIFGDKIETILRDKYYRSRSGAVWGFGKKLLP
jgi:hypothetical protein